MEAHAHQSEVLRSERSTPDGAPARIVDMIIASTRLQRLRRVFPDHLHESLAGEHGVYLSVPLMLVTVLIFATSRQDLRACFPGFVAEVTARPLAAVAAVVHPNRKIYRSAAPHPKPEPVSEAEFKALLRVSEFQGRSSRRSATDSQSL